MRKLALKLDELRVQSFATTPEAAAARGTVRGHETETEQHACSDACSLVLTCNSCEETCGAECDPTTTYDDPGRRIILY